VLESYVLAQGGYHLLKKHYKRDAVLSQAYATVIANLIPTEIHASLDTPLRNLRNQRLLHWSIVKLCLLKSGPRRLASFIVRILKDWPAMPIGSSTSSFDPVRDYGWRRVNRLLDAELPHWQKGSQDGLPTALLRRRLKRILCVIVDRAELREALLIFAQAGMKGRRSQLLRSALTDLFYHVQSEQARSLAQTTRDVLVVRGEALAGMPVREKALLMEEAFGEKRSDTGGKGQSSAERIVRMEMKRLRLR
jgi:hypothetical protein